MRGERLLRQPLAHTGHTPDTGIRLAEGCAFAYAANACFCSPWAITSRQNKKRPSHDTRLLGLSLAQALVSWDAGSGASIFTRVSCPQRLHLQGRFRVVVSGRSFRIFPLPHTGQITHPSFTLSLPQRMFDCNLFASFFEEMKENILTPETEKNRKAYSFCLLRRRLARGRFRPGALGSMYLIHAYSPYPLRMGPSFWRTMASGGAVRVT